MVQGTQQVRLISKGTCSFEVMLKHSNYGLICSIKQLENNFWKILFCTKNIFIAKIVGEIFYLIQKFTRNWKILEFSHANYI